MNRPLLIAALAVSVSVCACSSAPPADSAQGQMYFQSRHSVETLSDCLQRRFANVQTTSRDNRTDMFIDGRAWHIILEARGTQAVVSARRGPGGDAVEPEVRFALARCGV